jgi:hypothetical protein
MDGGEEIRVAVFADSRRLVGRDVGRIDRSEGQHEGPPAREGLPADRGVTGLAIRGADEIASLIDKTCIFEAVRNASRVAVLVAGERDPVSAGKIGRPGTEHDPADKGERRHSNNRDRREKETP